MSKLTIYDISNLSGVSITTVSRVINGHTNVNRETRDKVEEVIQKYGYTPKQSSRNFSQKNLYAVALLMEDIRHAYLAELAYAISQELSKWKVNTILCNIVDVEKEFINQVDNLMEKHVSGVILLGSIFENEICKIAIERRYSGFPFVTVNANFALMNVHEVMQDQSQGTKDAVKYLHRLGKKHIGWIYYNSSRSDQKKNIGFTEGMCECNMSVKRSCEVKDKSLSAGKTATAELFKFYPDTDAIIYSADILAVGGAHYLNQMHIPIPERIAIIGFNNSNCSKECYPPLTSIDNKIADSGKAAAQMMIKVLNKQPCENVLLPCGLAIRQSTP